jgi:hypothetical protein
MHTSTIRRSIAVLLCVSALVACSRTEDPPILKARLVSATLVSADPAVATWAREAGYKQLSFAANYPGTVRMHAIMWGVPEAVVEQALEFSAPGKEPSHVRVLTAQLPTNSSPIEGNPQSFYREVMGTDFMPGYPVVGKPPEAVRVLAWTYVIPDVLEANRRLRERNIPVVVSPVALTSPMFGDYKMLAIRAPDGELIELIEATAQ